MTMADEGFYGFGPGITGGNEKNRVKIGQAPPSQGVGAVTPVDDRTREEKIQDVEKRIREYREQLELWIEAERKKNIGYGELDKKIRDSERDIAEMEAGLESKTVDPALPERIRAVQEKRITLLQKRGSEEFDLAAYSADVEMFRSKLAEAEAERRLLLAGA